MNDLQMARNTPQYKFVLATAKDLLMARVTNNPNMARSAYDVIANSCIELADKLWHNMEVYTLRELDPATSLVVYDLSTATDENSILYSRLLALGWEPPQRYTCKFCGAASEIAPEDQVAPPDCCHPSDHKRA